MFRNIKKKNTSIGVARLFESHNIVVVGHYFEYLCPNYHNNKLE